MFLVPRSGPASKPRVLKGNWYEEHLAEEHRLTKFAEKRQSLQQSPPSGESQPLKWTGLAGHFDKVNRPYAPRTLPSTWTGATPSTAQPSSHKELKFGDYIQIQSEKGLTLTFDMWTHTFVPKTSSDSVTESDSEMLVLASATFKKGGNGTQGVETVSRNVFQIVKCDGEEYEDETVRHGVKFRILVPNGRFEKQVGLLLCLHLMSIVANLKS